MMITTMRAAGATLAAAVIAAVLMMPSSAWASRIEGPFTFAYARSEMQTPEGSRALNERLHREAREHCASTEVSVVAQLGCRRALVNAVVGAMAERAAMR